MFPCGLVAVAVLRRVSRPICLFSSAACLCITSATAQRQVGPINALVFSIDGSRLYSAGFGRVVVHNAKTGAVLHAWPCSLEQVHGLSLSQEGRSLIAVGGQPGVSGGGIAIDTRTGRVLNPFSGGTDLSMAAAILSDGRIALASADRLLRVVDPVKKSVSVARGHTGPILAAALHTLGGLIATAGSDRTIRVWDAKTLAARGVLAQHTEPVNSLAFRPNTEGEPILASAGDDGTVRIWQPRIGRMMRIVRGHEGRVLALAFSSDGQRLFSGSSDGLVREIDPDSDRIIQSWRITNSWVHSIAISPNGLTIAAGDSNGKVIIIPTTKVVEPKNSARRVR